MFLGKHLLAKDKNPPGGAKTKGELIRAANSGAGRAFRFVPGPHPISITGSRIQLWLFSTHSGPWVSATDDFFLSVSATSLPLLFPPTLPLSFRVSYTEHVATLKQCLQPRAFISIWSTAHHCLSDLQCHIRGNEHRVGLVSPSISVKIATIIVPCLEFLWRLKSVSAA